MKFWVSPSEIKHASELAAGELFVLPSGGLAIRLDGNVERAMYYGYDAVVLSQMAILDVATLDRHSSPVLSYGTGWVVEPHEVGKVHSAQGGPETALRLCSDGVRFLAKQRGQVELISLDDEVPAYCGASVPVTTWSLWLSQEDMARDRARPVFHYTGDVE